MHELYRTGCRFFVETKGGGQGRLALLVFLLAFAGLSLEGCDKESGTPKGEAGQTVGGAAPIPQCASSAVGTFGCQCLGGSGGHCQPGLVCQEGACIEPLQCEPPGILNCICSDSLPCGPGLKCDSGSCRSCGTNMIGCSCMNNADCGSAGMKCKQNACKCAPGYLGPNCKYSNATTCNGGVVDAAGNCTCVESRTGPSCGQCAAGYAGRDCQYSDDAQCNGNGTVDNQGQCECALGWGEDRCTACATGYFGAECATECPGGPAKPCSGNGDCDAGTGVCACNTGWDDPNCSSCATGYVTHPQAANRCCHLGTVGCECDTAGDTLCNSGLLCQEGICVAPGCVIGEESCACRTKTAELTECDVKVEVGIEEPMYCSNAVCRSRSCEPGTTGCICIGGNTGFCLNGDDCQNKICGGLTKVKDDAGSFLQDCRVATEDEATSDRCDWGFRCDHKPNDALNHPGTCLPCDPGTQACQCREGLGEEPCEAGLDCVRNDFGGRCEYTEFTTGLPCFSVCNKSSESVDADGATQVITCGSDHLAAGCIYGSPVCERGGCYTADDSAGEEWEECEIDPDCPTFQRCLYDPGLMKKLCASNCGPKMPWACDSESECISGVCRPKCTIDDILECENSGDKCKRTKTGDPESKDGFCFTRTPENFENEASNMIATFRLSPESDDGKILSSIEFKEIPKSNPARYRASFTLHNTAPWSQTFYVTKQQQTLPNSNGVMESRSVPSQTMRRGTGAACLPGTLGCVPVQKGKCSPWIDSMYQEAGQSCTILGSCDPTGESGVVCNTERKVCERQTPCVDPRQCDQNVSGIDCISGECVRTVATVKGSDGRCKLSEEGKNSGEPGNVLSFLKVGLDWNKIDPDDDNDGFAGSLDNVAYQEFTIEPGEKSPIELQFESVDACPVSGECKWQGELEVSTVDGAKKKVIMTYSEGTKSLWGGSIVYFASFPRPERWDGINDTAPLTTLSIRDQISSTNNALLQAYKSFETMTNQNDKDIDQLIDALGSAKKDLWLTGEDCESAEGGPCTTCRQTTSKMRCIGVSGGHMPSGPLEMPFMAYLDFSGSGSQKSHVVTEGALHYPGSPAIDLERAGVSSNRFRKFNKFKSVSVLDGHYLVDDSANGQCDPVDEVLAKVPWIAAIGADSVCDGSCSNRVVKECRGKNHPFGDEHDKNQNFTLANPLKDGSRIRRELNMIDGGILDGTVSNNHKKQVILLFRETISFEGTSGIKPAVSYGYIHLENLNLDLDTSDRENYQEPAVPASTVDPYKTRDWCGPALDKLEAAKPEIQRTQLENGSIEIGPAQKIIMALYTGREEIPDNKIKVELKCRDDSGSDSECAGKIAGAKCGSGLCQYKGDGDTKWTIHYLCEETGLFDERCPRESTRTFFLKKKSDSDFHGDFNGDKEITCESEAPAHEESWRADVHNYIEVQFDRLGLTASPSCINHVDRGNNGNPVNTGCAVEVTNEGHGLKAPGLELPHPAPCKDQLDDWLENHPKTYQPAIYECQSEKGCDQVDNPIGGKKFYQPVNEPALLSPLQGGGGLVNSAFSYVTKFQSSAAGATVGLAFVPEICPAIETTGYCYSPEKISEVAARNECLLYLYAKNPDGAFDDDTLKPVVEYIKESLAYSSLGGDYGVVTIQSGFEKLYSEFLIMMGDDALTAALSSRFDLAGITIGDFPGTKFEANGVDLTGLAGGEMRNFYKAAQYFQAVLDRFQRNLLLLAKVEKRDSASLTKILTAKMATTYLDKVIEAAKKKAKAWSYIGQRYHNLERPGLARTVIERAYSAAFFENMLISSAMRTVLGASAAEKRVEIRANLKKAQTGFSVALTRMQDDSTKMNAELNYFGYRDGYIPFPGLEVGAGRDNGFEVQIQRAKGRLAWASTKENDAIETSRSIATDAAEFFNELEEVENQIEAQLLDKCGSFTADNGQVYPAILDYMDYLPVHLKTSGDPCGSPLLESGSIYEAKEQYQITVLDFQKSHRLLAEKVEIVQNGLDNIKASCDAITNFNQQMKAITIGQMTVQSYIAESQRALAQSNQLIGACFSVNNTMARRSALHDCAGHTSPIPKIDPPACPGGEQPSLSQNVGAVASAALIGAASTAQGITTLASNVFISLDEKKQRDLKKAELDLEAEKDCKMLTNQGKLAIQDTLSDMTSAKLGINEAQKRMEIQGHRIASEHKAATRLLAELHEMKELTINKAAAQNNPNFRIYRDDNVRNAEYSFKKALAEAYKATLVYQYYTSESYEPYGKLLLARMVNYGEHNLQNYLYDLEDAFWEFEDRYGVPELRVLPLSLKDDIFTGMRVGPDGKAYSEREVNDSVSKWLESSLNENGVASLSFRIGQEHISPNTRVHKISYIEACVESRSSSAARHPRINLNMGGKPIIWAFGDAEPLRSYNFGSRPSIVTARWCAGKDFTWDPKIFRSEKYTQRPLFNTEWQLSIDFAREPANSTFGPEHFDELKLFFYYFEYIDF